MKSPPIFILGPPRCGKTLLGRMLSRHHGLQTVDESTAMKHRGIPFGEFEPSAELEAVAATVRRDLSGPAGERRVIETSARNAFRLPFLQFAFPLAHYVIVRRDEADIARDMVRGRRQLSSARGKWWRFQRRLGRRDFRNMSLRSLFQRAGSRYLHVRVPNAEELSHLTIEEYDAAAIRLAYEQGEALARAKPGVVLSVNFGDILERPRDVLMEVLEHIGEMTTDDEMDRMCARMRPRGLVG